MQQEKIWNYFQGAGVDSFRGNSTRLRFLAGRLTPTERRVLNIGVGNGYLERMLCSVRGTDVYALDPDEEAIERLRTEVRMNEDHAQVGYSQAMPFPAEYFDVVIMSEVIEHLDDAVITATFHEVTRVLRKGGRYLGTVPADEQLERSLVACPHCGQVFHRWGHVQSFSRERLGQWLARDFDAVTVRHVYFGSWATLNWKGRAKWLAKKSLHMAGVAGAGENLYFEASRRVAA